MVGARIEVRGQAAREVGRAAVRDQCVDHRAGFGSLLRGRSDRLGALESFLRTERF